jgi:hypothetical protein
MREFYVNTGIPEEFHKYEALDPALVTGATCCRYVSHQGAIFPVLETMRIFSSDRNSIVVIHKISAEGDKYCVHMSNLVAKAGEEKIAIPDVSSALSIIGEYEKVCQPNGNYCENKPGKFLKLMAIFGFSEEDE